MTDSADLPPESTEQINAAPSRRRRSLFERAVGGTVDAAVGVRGVVNHQVTGATKTVVDDLEPYLIAETIPRIVDALVPHLIDEVVPRIMEGIGDYLATETVPSMVTAMTPELVEEILPQLLEQLQPYLEQSLIPSVVDSLVPHIIDEVAPRVIEGIMPMIHERVIPEVLDDFVDDPRIRDLIREQSAGLLFDAIESFRRGLAIGDDRVEALGRKIRRAATVAAVHDPGPLLPNRSRSHAGGVSRGVSLAIDLALMSFITSQGFSAAVSILTLFWDPLPQTVAAGLALFFAALTPLYFAVLWYFLGRTVGAGICGYAVVDRDGGRPRLLRTIVRAYLLVPLLLVWTVGMVRSPIDPYRRGWLELLTRTRTPYRVWRGLRAVPDQSTGASPVTSSSELS